jgi:hypothetical protein
MRENSACAALKRQPDATGGAAPASDHLPIDRRSIRANEKAAKTLLFEVPYTLTQALLASLQRLTSRRHRSPRAYPKAMCTCNSNRF